MLEVASFPRNLASHFDCVIFVFHFILDPDTNWIRIKVKNRIRIRIKVKSRIRIRITRTKPPDVLLPLVLVIFGRSSFLL
jgi:hypothetical protein